MDRLIILILFITYTLSMSAESNNNPVCSSDTTILIPRQNHLRHPHIKEKDTGHKNHLYMFAIKTMFCFSEIVTSIAL